MSPKAPQPVDAEADNVEYSRVGGWDVYRAKPDKLPAISSLPTLEETLTSLPYVIRAIKVLVFLCYKTLLIYVISGLVASLLPATSLFYSSQLLQVVQDSIDSRSIDKRLLFRILFSRIGCMGLSRMARMVQSQVSKKIVSKMRAHYSGHILHAHSRLDVPTYDDPAVQSQLGSARSSRNNAAWSCIRTIVTFITAVIQLVSQVSVLMNVLKDQPDGTWLALLSIAQPVLSWVLRYSSQPPGGASHYNHRQ